MPFVKKRFYNRGIDDFGAASSGFREQLPKGARVVLFGMLGNRFSLRRKFRRFVRPRLCPDRRRHRVGIDVLARCVWGDEIRGSRRMKASTARQSGPIAAAVVALGVLAARRFGQFKACANYHAAPRTCAIHARDIDCGDRGKRNFVPLRQPDRAPRREHGRANRCLASSQRRAYVRRRIHRHLRRPDRRQWLAKCG